MTADLAEVETEVEEEEEEEEAIVLSLKAAPDLSFSVTALAQNDRVRRPARLFVAGEYPDKGITVTPGDLAKIVAAFHAEGRPVPVKAEHHDGPLDPLGEVVALHVEGDELYGMLVFSAGIDAHLRERHVEHLSVCLARASDGSLRLKEASLVCAPRVPGAGFLPPEAVEEKLASFRRAGKLTPAMEPHARRLFSAPAGITFSDGSASDVAAELEALLRALPVVQPREGTAAAAPIRFAAGTGDNAPPAEVTRLAQSFGLDPQRVAKNLGRR